MTAVCACQGIHLHHETLGARSKVVGDDVISGRVDHDVDGNLEQVARGDQRLGPGGDAYADDRPDGRIVAVSHDQVPKPVEGHALGRREQTARAHDSLCTRCLVDLVDGPQVRIVKVDVAIGCADQSFRVFQAVLATSPC